MRGERVFLRVREEEKKLWKEAAGGSRYMSAFIREVVTAASEEVVRLRNGRRKK